jgi:hypothetical protein
MFFKKHFLLIQFVTGLVTSGDGVKLAKYDLAFVFSAGFHKIFYMAEASWKP